MNYILPVTTGFLFSAAIYFLLHRSFFKIIVGTILFTNAINLLLFQSAELVKAAAPIIGEGEQIMADPLPQALILTAIVISFAIQTFLIILVKRLHLVSKADNTDQLTQTDVV